MDGILDCWMLDGKSDHLICWCSDLGGDRIVGRSCGGPCGMSDVGDFWSGGWGWGWGLGYRFNEKSKARRNFSKKRGYGNT